MAAQTQRSAPMLVVGLFFGLLLGYFLKSLSEAERASVPGPQPAPRPRSRDVDPHDAPPAQGDRAAESAAKAHFMKKFVAALVSLPKNAKPNAAWSSPLLDPSNPISCQDCHDPTRFNIEGMKQMDPGAEAVQSYRQNKRFMIMLMMNWVERLNREHGDRLETAVTCTTCHADDPSGGMAERQQRAQDYSYFMTTFLRALEEKPATNRGPAARWQPLLKEPGTVRCSSCHKDEFGAAMDKNVLGARDLPRPPRLADDKVFMVDLMEKWVEKLNREARDQLTKVVVCQDCHENDPRR
ncbi:MAG: hypothetical protein ACT4PV_05750 [Planctomycetaceae bacterium]